MKNKQFNEFYRDFEGMSKSKTISDIANWLDEHEEFTLISRTEISITFKKCDLLVCITNSGTSRVILKRL